MSERDWVFRCTFLLGKFFKIYQDLWFTLICRRSKSYFVRFSFWKKNICFQIASWASETFFKLLFFFLQLDDPQLNRRVIFSVTGLFNFFQWYLTFKKLNFKSNSHVISLFLKNNLRALSRIGSLLLLSFFFLIYFHISATYCVVRSELDYMLIESRRNETLFKIPANLIMKSKSWR